MNSWEAAMAARAAGHPDVFLSYRSRNGHRDVTPNGWQVIRPEYKTDPDGQWFYQYNKTFVGNKNSEALQQAMAWASDKYGVTEWVKVPGFQGDYFPAEAAPAIKAAKQGQPKRLRR
jgi:hypothetical protein